VSLVKVRYLGIADIRTITVAEWAGAGVTVDKDAVWSIWNRFTLVLDLNERMEEILRGEGHFSLSAVTDAGGVETIATASNPDSEGDILVDGTTGATTPVKEEHR
jgi:hypothetical protein